MELPWRCTSSAEVSVKEWRCRVAAGHGCPCGVMKRFPVSASAKDASQDASRSNRRDGSMTEAQVRCTGLKCGSRIPMSLPVLGYFGH